MKNIEFYGLQGLCCGNGTLTRQQDQERFEKTQKAMAEFRRIKDSSHLGDFYKWLQEEKTNQMN